MRYILNSAVITSPGSYQYRLLYIHQAIEWLNEGKFKSTIGYEETAYAMSKIFDIVIPVNRCTITMKSGDEALVFRLVFPPGTPRISPENKGMLTTQFILENCEIGLLTKK